MTGIPGDGDGAITPEALRALTAWTFTFSVELRRAVTDLASQGDSGSAITIDLIQQAVVLASKETAAAASGLVEEHKGDGTERTAA